jgi:hypothetical protein
MISNDVIGMQRCVLPTSHLPVSSDILCTNPHSTVTGAARCAMPSPEANIVTRAIFFIKNHYDSGFGLRQELCEKSEVVSTPCPAPLNWRASLKETGLNSAPSGTGHRQMGDVATRDMNARCCSGIRPTMRTIQDSRIAWANGKSGLKGDHSLVIIGSVARDILAGRHFGNDDWKE